eukprot:403344769
MLAAFLGLTEAGLNDWYKDLKGHRVTSMPDLQDYTNSEDGGSGKSAVFVNFYQTFCGTCMDDMPDWNQIQDEMKEIYGNQVTFLIVDVKQQKGLVKFYGIRSTPYVAFLGLGGSNDGWNEFKGKKTVANYRAWMTEQIEDKCGIRRINGGGNGLTQVSSNKQTLCQTECHCDDDILVQTGCVDCGCSTHSASPMKQLAQAKCDCLVRHNGERTHQALQVKASTKMSLHDGAGSSFAVTLKLALCELRWPEDLAGYQARSMNDIYDWAQSQQGGNGKAAVFSIFYQWGCHPCRDDMPHWNEAVHNMKQQYGDLVTFIKVNSKDQTGILSRYGINSTPKVVFMGIGADEKGVNAFRGSRSAENYVNWMTKQLRDFLPVSTQREIQQNMMPSQNPKMNMKEQAKAKASTKKPGYEPKYFFELSMRIPQE